MVDVQSILEPYNPWWSEQVRRIVLPSFKRPIFYNLYEELKTLPQILSITGPRRVGKSTLLLQLTQTLLSEGIEPRRIIYYSLDDPVLASTRMDVDHLIDAMMKTSLQSESRTPTYIFLDEIQRLYR